MLLSGLAALLISHLGYGLYLAGVARRFGASSLGRCFVASFPCLGLQVGLVILVEAALGYWKWFGPSIDAVWKENLMLCSVAMVCALAAAWTVLLWKLRQCLPREEVSCALDEE
jgi:hypothetical protein